jgi:hypothetical protein
MSQNVLEQWQMKSSFVSICIMQPNARLDLTIELTVRILGQ